MKKTLRDVGIASIPDLRAAALESDVKRVACQMTVDLFGYSKAECIPEIDDWIGARTISGAAPAR